MITILRRQGILLLFFAGGGFLALYPLFFHLTTHVPGNVNTDYSHFHWSFWWVRHALTTPDLSLYETNYVMYPYTANLAYHTMAVAWLPIWVTLEPLIGSIGAMNLIFWIALTLTGYCTYLLLCREGVPLNLALLAGVAVEVSPQLLRAVWWTNPNLIGMFWFPLHLLIWGEIARRVTSPPTPSPLMERGSRGEVSGCKSKPSGTTINLSAGATR